MKLFYSLALLLSFMASANECAQDAKKLCAGIEPGKGQLAKCLQDYATELSPNCAKELKSFRTKTAKMNPCFEDLADLCVDIPTESRKLEYCLLKNETKLSSTCANDFKSKKIQLMVRDVCAQDVVNYCFPQISQPEGAINHCLIRNRQKLSVLCKKNIEKQISKMKAANPCFDATESFCPKEVKFADIQACLEKKLNLLPTACKKLVQTEIDKSHANPCYKDLTRHCVPGLNINEQHRCLSLNEKELSRECRQYRNVEKEKIDKMVTLCEADRLKFCPTAPFQNGMVAKCLRQNKAKLTKTCADLL